MGIAHLKTKDYFAEVVGGCSDDTSSLDPSIVEAKVDEDNQDSGECEIPNEDMVNDPSEASDASEQPSQAVTGFWLPESLRRCLLPKHIRVSGNNDDLLPEINETELGQELKEEEELDARDLLSSKDFEAGLWGL